MSGFIDTFLGTSLTLFCAWIFKKYIEPKLDKLYHKFNKIRKKYLTKYWRFKK